MILGTTYPVVSVYSGSTLVETINFKQVTGRNFLTHRNQIKREYVNDFTKKIEYKVEGYLFEEEITIESGDWRRGNIKKWADENNILSTESEIHRAIRLINYSGLGYTIYYWSHNDAKTLGFAGEIVTVTENRNFDSIYEDKLTLNFKGKTKRAFVLIPEFSLWKLIWDFEAGKTVKLIWDFEAGQTAKTIWDFEDGKTSKVIWTFGDRIDNCETLSSQFVTIDKCQDLLAQLQLIDACQDLQSQLLLIEKCQDLISQIYTIDKCESLQSQVLTIDKCEQLFNQVSTIDKCEDLIAQV